MAPLVAVTRRRLPAVVGAVYVTVAAPVPFVSDVALLNEPAAADHVTVRELSGASLPYWSRACAVTVTDPPTVGDVVDRLTANELVAAGRISNEFVEPVFPPAVPEPVPVAVMMIVSAFVYVRLLNVSAETPEPIDREIVPPRVPVPDVVRSTETVEPELFTTLPKSSVSVTVREKAEPAVCQLGVVRANLDAAAAVTVTDALEPAVNAVPDATVAVIVCAPAVLNVTEKSLVPDTRAAFDGSVAAPSDDVIAMVCVEDDTTFQFASTAFTVAVMPDPATSSVGVPVLPVDVPGAAVSPGSSTCTLVAVPALTVNAADVPASEPPDVRVAVTVCDDPARVSVMAWELRTPAVKAAVVVDVSEEKRDVDVRVAVPVKFVTVRPPESCAVILTLKDVPAV